MVFLHYAKYIGGASPASMLIQLDQRQVYAPPKRFPAEKILVQDATHPGSLRFGTLHTVRIYSILI